MTKSENGYDFPLSAIKIAYMKSKKDDIYYEAMLARDHRFDGKFFVGVTTTGIYCRPICPAKPKRKNVEFFANYMAAERAGYRPCLRCRPESAPKSPVWVGKSAIVKRAIRLIHDQSTIDFDEDQFAALFGVSARHLRRVFVDEIGKTPKQIASENRLNLARKLIVETKLPITEIAFASGFESIRRFNDAFKLRFKKSPSEIRRKKIADPSTISITLSYRPPYDFQGLLNSYRIHAMGNLEWFEKDRMTRVIAYEGQVGTVEISNLAEKSQLLVKLKFPSTAHLQSILNRVRSMFDLDSDPVVVANSLEKNPAVKKILRRFPGIRIPSGWDSFELAIATILGQLVSVERGRALVAQLIEMLGQDTGLTHEGRAIKLFPRPEQIAQSELKELKTTEARKAALRAFSQALVDKKISLEPTQDIDAFYAQLKNIKGIGPWTTNYMALKAIKHTDAFPATDLIIARTLEQHPVEVVNAMSPWRGYVAALFWREYSHKLSKANKSKKEKK